MVVTMYLTRKIISNKKCDILFVDENCTIYIFLSLFTSNAEVGYDWIMLNGSFPKISLISASMNTMPENDRCCRRNRLIGYIPKIGRSE